MYEKQGTWEACFGLPLLSATDPQPRPFKGHRYTYAQLQRYFGRFHTRTAGATEAERGGRGLATSFHHGKSTRSSEWERHCWRLAAHPSDLGPTAPGRSVAEHAKRYEYKHPLQPIL